MVDQLQRPLPQATFAWIQQTGKPEQVFAEYVANLDILVRALGIGNFSVLTGTSIITLIGVAAPSNANAAAAGVPLGGLYRNTADPSAVFVRTV